MLVAVLINSDFVHFSKQVASDWEQVRTMTSTSLILWYMIKHGCLT